MGSYQVNSLQQGFCKACVESIGVLKCHMRHIWAKVPEACLELRASGCRIEVLNGWNPKP